MEKEKKVKEKKVQSRKKKVVKTVISAIVSIVLVVVLVVANIMIPTYSLLINSVIGFNESIDNSSVDTKGLDLEYNKADYTEENLKEAEQALNEEIAGEGIVLLKNDNNLMPFAKETKFSFFSTSSIKFATSRSFKTNLKDSFESRGFGVNKNLWDFYTDGAGSKYGLGEGSINYGRGENFSINECPLSLINETSGLMDSVNGTIPVFVLKRVAGEGRDMPRSMYQHATNPEDQAKSYLEPDSNELEILKYLNDNFTQVVLIINTASAMELEWINDYKNIQSVIFAPATGDYGLNSLADIFAGTINPSAKTVDTFAADTLASPAAQNFGDYVYYTENGEQTGYNYISYKEGIYVGYKYFETRYEDAVLGQGNAGEFDYSMEVCYPFGFGLSYTTFEWSNYQTNWDGTTCTVTVDVKNTGDVPGKDVVEIYAQSPYTDYDKQNNVEKSSVELVGYSKSSLLEAGASETVTVTFDQEQLKAYDYTTAKTYILDAGDYYITAATDAHSAINNILAAKGKTTANGMTNDGNSDLVKIYTPKNSKVDIKTYAEDSYTGAEIVNQFDDVNGGLTYLSRQDWTGTWPTHDGEVSDQISTWGNEINGKDAEGKPVPYVYYKTINQEDLDKIEAEDSLSPIDESQFDDEIVFGADNDLSLIDVRGMDYDHPLWDKLLDQLQPDDYQQIITKSGYGTIPLESVGKPLGRDADAANGLAFSGTNMFFPSNVILAQTWNISLSEKFGQMIGNDAIVGGATGWYAPSMNIHRTPFGGRNWEYYSEDGFLSGYVAAASVKGAASKGMYTYIKHYALNDQENHRGDTKGQFGLCTWSNEQAIREIYLKPFELSMKAGDITLNYIKTDKNGNLVNATKEIRACQALMTAFNRIGYTWTGGSYPLITGILRNEWGFNGFIITDNANTGVFMGAAQMIEAGADAKLANIEVIEYKFDKNSITDYHYGRQAMHHMLYTIANSKVMNGQMPGYKYNMETQMDKILLVGIDVFCGVLLLLMLFFTIRRFKKK